MVVDRRAKGFHGGAQIHVIIEQRGDVFSQLPYSRIE
jgi:hypothetical protein